MRTEMLQSLLEPVPGLNHPHLCNKEELSWRNFPGNCRNAHVCCYRGEDHPRFVIGLKEGGLPLYCSNIWYGFSSQQGTAARHLPDFNSIQVSLCLAQCPVSGSTVLGQSGKNQHQTVPEWHKRDFFPHTTDSAHAVKQRISEVCVCIANRKVICAAEK